MEEIKSFFKKIKWDSLLIAILTVAVGILCVALPDQSGDVLCIVFGVSLLATGVALIVRYFTVERLFGEHLLISAVVAITLGIFCLIYPNAIQSILTVLFGLFILIDSISSISDSIYCARAKVKGWPWMFILSVLTACLGAAVMFSNFETVMIFAGVSLIIEGIKQFVITCVFSHKIKQAKKMITSSKDDDIVL